MPEVFATLTQDVVPANEGIIFSAGDVLIMFANDAC